MVQGKNVRDPGNKEPLMINYKTKVSKPYVLIASGFLLYVVLTN